MKKITEILLTLIMSVLLVSTGFAAPTDAKETEPETTAQETLAEKESETETTTEATAEKETTTEAAETETKTETAAFEDEDVFAQWNKDAPALNVLVDYMEDITDEDSENYIPIKDRIAVFDMDGTIYGELFPTYLEYYLFAWRVLKDPTCNPDEEMLEVAREILEDGPAHSYPEDMAIRHATQAARAYAGMTLTEFADFVTTALLREADGFEGMTYGEAFYQPILEVIDYLQENEFQVYLVSGSDRFICRTLLEGAVDIPEQNIIGMDVALEATGQGDADGLDYAMTAKDQLVRTDKLLIKNLKMNKVLQIAKEIGHQPVLSFGNSSGDTSMHMYTISNNPYKSEAFMLIADDEERDYGNTEKAQELGKKWEEAGFHVISMKDDFKTIYGENVKKTGDIHWTKDLGPGELEAIFAGSKKQTLKKADGTTEELDTLWLYYSDGTFKQYVFLDGKLTEFSNGTYSFEENGDFYYDTADTDHGDIVINRTHKYEDGKGLTEYQSSHAFDLGSMGFDLLYLSQSHIDAAKKAADKK